jgi:hypothetical protein
MSFLDETLSEHRQFFNDIRLTTTTVVSERN